MLAYASTPWSAYAGSFCAGTLTPDRRAKLEAIKTAESDTRERFGAPRRAQRYPGSFSFYSLGGVRHLRRVLSILRKRGKRSSRKMNQETSDQARMSNDEGMIKAQMTPGISFEIRHLVINSDSSFGLRHCGSPPAFSDRAQRPRAK